jgi:hypothetical protein
MAEVGDAAKTMQARVEGMVGDELDLVEAELTRGGHMAGAEFSAADVQMMFPLAARAADHQSSSNWAWAGKFQAKSSGWHGNRTFLEGDVLEVEYAMAAGC